MKYNGIDIYKALIQDETDGVYCISLVDYPAVEKNFVCFKTENKEKVYFSIESEEKQNITGVVMVADTPIYRRNGDYEYYITYSKETIELMANKLLKDGLQNRFSIMHDGNLISGISMTELYIKDSTKGINPNFISDIPEGSLMATLHVEDADLWENIKTQDFLKGFSLEGLFTIEQMQNNKRNKNSTMSKLTKFIKSLMKFGEILTDKGKLYWEGDGELAVDVEVFVDGEEEDEKVVAGDGEYVVDDKTIIVENGKVTEIQEKEQEEEISVSASRQKFNRIMEIYEESYEDKEAKIITAIRAKGFDCWLVEAGDEFAVVECWVDETVDYIHYKFPITWENEEPIIGEPIEVKSEYVPVNSEPKITEEEQEFKTNSVIDELNSTIEEMRTEISTLRTELSEISSKPAAEPIVEEFETLKNSTSKTNKAANLLSHFKD